jgi:hypothetical protein
MIDSVMNLFNIKVLKSKVFKGLNTGVLKILPLCPPPKGELKKACFFYPLHEQFNRSPQNSTAPCKLIGLTIPPLEGAQGEDSRFSVYTKILASLAITFTLNVLHAQFPPPAGQPGTTAIHKDSSAINAWATGIEVSRGLINISDPAQTHEGSNYASFGVPENALGPASGNSVDVVSLGDGGIATLTFARPIKNGPGPDFCVFENAFSDTYLELAFVEVSSDGVRFVRFPAISLTQTDEQIGGFGSLDATKIHNLAGKYRQGYGTPFDLEDLIDSTDIDLNNITHVRIIDVVGSINPSYGTQDSQGNFINDLFPTPFYSGGFDLDAVGVIHEQIEVGLSAEDELVVMVYPNPSSGEFYLKGIQDFDKVSIEIHNISGQTCEFNFNPANGQFFFRNEEPNGVYFMKISSMGREKWVRLILVNN